MAVLLPSFEISRRERFHGDDGRVSFVLEL